MVSSLLQETRAEVVWHKGPWVCLQGVAEVCEEEQERRFGGVANQWRPQWLNEIVAEGGAT